MKLVIVRDMWLTGFDAPCLHTIYIDKPMRGHGLMQAIARELVETVRRNVTIDWTQKESVKANLRRLVKRLLRKYGYPPDKQEKATVMVLEQAETLYKNWAA
ncbi:type I restriction enzyme endonuclease domain-containing protein [Scytonema sp. PRP1]|uniref:type I restriction enzyme endonuclease domain-containing protein n=1 Tax=Scytonema sp. PRP1 TaxID=3120513 RepID=UPI002FD27113